MYLVVVGIRLLPILFSLLLPGVIMDTRPRPTSSVFLAQLHDDKGNYFLYVQGKAETWCINHLLGAQFLLPLQES